MVVREERERVKALLAETITLLCKNGLNYKAEFCVEALIGITLDKDDVFLVNIKETIKTHFEEKAPETDRESPSRKRRKKRRPRSISDDERDSKVDLTVLIDENDSRSSTGMTGVAPVPHNTVPSVSPLHSSTPSSLRRVKPPVLQSPGSTERDPEVVSTLTFEDMQGDPGEIWRLSGATEPYKEPGEGGNGDKNTDSYQTGGKNNDSYHAGGESPQKRSRPDDVNVNSRLDPEDGRSTESGQWSQGPGNGETSSRPHSSQDEIDDKSLVMIKEEPHSDLDDVNDSQYSYEDGGHSGSFPGSSHYAMPGGQLVSMGGPQSAASAWPGMSGMPLSSSSVSAAAAGSMAAMLAQQVHPQSTQSEMLSAAVWPSDRPPRVHRCGICSMEFARRCHVQRHVSTVHNKNTSRDCMYCTSSFSRDDNLLRHIKNIHGVHMTMLELANKLAGNDGAGIQEKCDADVSS